MPEHIDTETRQLLMTIRQACIMILGALEEYLGLPRTIIPRHKRPPKQRSTAPPENRR